MKIKTACPVCGNISFDFVSELFFKPDIPEEFGFYKDRFFVQCIRCGTVMQMPLIVEQDDFMKYGKAYYNQMAKSTQEGEDAINNHITFGQIPMYETCENFLKSSVDPTEHHKWLDVGSAGVPTTFKDFDFTTIEPDERTVMIGRKRFATEKINCATLETYDPKEQYDGVLFHNSFYCLPDPEKSLQKASQLLKRGGVVAIAICSYFMETSTTSPDTRYLRIEEVYRGDVLWAYYNRFSLKYLMERCGFVYVQDKVLQYSDCNRKPWFSARYFLFNKAGDTTQANPQDLQESNLLNKQLLKKLEYDFSQSIRNTLSAINNKNYFLIGNRDILFDLQRFGPMDSIGGVVDYENSAIFGISQNGLNFVDVNAILDNPQANLIVASFKSREAIAAALRKKFSFAKIFVANRSSGIERLIHERFGLCKGFEIVPYNG
jgi:SAM-dependent methyltransferase